MSSTFAPIDPATITALNAGGERALEQIFREHYPWLLEKALERLKGENAAAPRLIAATVRELWEERDGFHTSAEIEAFFNEELRHRARAIRARMTAVHRFEKAEGVHVPAAHAPPSVDQLWTEIATALHQPVVDAATAAQRRREHRSHEVAEHINTVTQRAAWKTPAIIAIVATVVAIAGAMWFSQRSRAEVVNQLLGSADAQTIVTRAGQLGSATLADNSVARLGPETRVVVVPRFGSDYRTLSIAGTAVFTVAGGGSHPFEARLGDVSVRSEGGVFTVRDFGEESHRLIRADSGSLTVILPRGERTLAAGEALHVDRNGEAGVPPEDDAAQGFAWTAGTLVLRDVSVTDAAQALWRWYGMDITVTDSAAGTRVLSLDVPLESSQGAIAAIENAGQVRFVWVDGKMTFQPGRPRR
jgi:ferric-dicitrate binding protein FerR (iron transport regulator)